MWIKKQFRQESIHGVEMGIANIGVPGFALSVHCFVVDGVLIDTGSQSLEKAFIPFFQQQDIDQVVITHYHEDHTGCAAYLQETRKVPIYMNEMTIAYCQKEADYPAYRKIFWGKRRPFQAQPIGQTFTSRRANWDVIETPGHSADHLAFLNRETGQLFTGDLYCHEKTKVILREESIPNIMASLRKVLTYDFQEVFCCHAGYLPDGRTALQRKLDYLEDLQGNILRMHKKGMTPEEIRRQLFPKKYPIIFFSFGEWDSLHIIHSVLKAA
ncbi:MAG: MBL fold metallo-hydrolase [Bacillaceae bacterium G1]|nr:MBL fold metallo-hydrolase [Bacillota bacterium]OJF16616.1 MAG: MBL fold metallo-hydrolase [Bacillaceae bacterium G1]